jgi:hypothetical protein
MLLVIKLERSEPQVAGLLGSPAALLVLLLACDAKILIEFRLIAFIAAVSCGGHRRDSDARSRSGWRYWLPEQRKATPADHSPELHPEHAFVFRTSHARLPQLSNDYGSAQNPAPEGFGDFSILVASLFPHPSSTLPPTLMAMDFSIYDALDTIRNSVLKWNARLDELNRKFPTDNSNSLDSQRRTAHQPDHQRTKILSAATQAMQTMPR